MSGQVDRLASRRRTLVESAFAVFAERGYHAAGVADIVKHAGVSHGTFYNYFDNKRDVLDAVVDLGVERLIREVVGAEHLAAPATLDDAADGFRTVLRRLFDVIEREPELVEFVMLTAPSIDDALVQRLLGSFATFATLTSAFVHGGSEHGYVRDDVDLGIAAEGMLALMFSVVLLRVRGPVSDEDRDRHIDTLAELAFHGILA